MFKITVTICLIMMSFIGKTQTSNSERELKLIEATLMDYIEGTSYSRIDQIIKAFYPDANLYERHHYLTDYRNKAFQYVLFFTHRQ